LYLWWSNEQTYIYIATRVITLHKFTWKWCSRRFTCWSWSSKPQTLKWHDKVM
jgi:hypothetical protein